MRIGEFVIVKSFPSDPVVRRIFEENDDCFKLCLEEDFRLWEEQGIKPEAVRCPKSRVFNYDQELYVKLKEAAYKLEDQDLLKALWEKARFYDEDINLISGVSSNVT